MIDLHMHSKYSTDGIEEVDYMLELAEGLGLKCISITDHNSCLAYKDLKSKQVRAKFSGDIITGVELNTKVLGIPIEILGYNIDTEKLEMLIESTYLSVDERNKIEVSRIYEKAVNAGIELPQDFIQNYDGTIYCSKYFHNYIIQNSNNKKYISEASWNDSNIFYREYMSNPTTAFFVDMDDSLPSFEESCRIVKEAGGDVFLPHIYEYRENSERILKYILENYKIDGIECYYRNFTEEQSKYLLDICDKHNLFISGGSDYHGRVKPHIKMGVGEGSLNVPDNIVNKWKKVVI